MRAKSQRAACPDPSRWFAPGSEARGTRHAGRNVFRIVKEQVRRRRRYSRWLCFRRPPPSRARTRSCVPSGGHASCEPRAASHEPKAETASSSGSRHVARRSQLLLAGLLPSRRGGFLGLVQGPSLPPFERRSYHGSTPHLRAGRSPVRSSKPQPHGAAGRVCQRAVGPGGTCGTPEGSRTPGSHRSHNSHLSPSPLPPIYMGRLRRLASSSGACGGVLRCKGLTPQSFGLARSTQENLPVLPNVLLRTAWPAGGLDGPRPVDYDASVQHQAIPGATSLPLVEGTQKTRPNLYAFSDRRSSPSPLGGGPG